jgi:hypothetical protein
MTNAERTCLQLKLLWYVRQQTKPVPFGDLWNQFLLDPVLANWKPFQHVVEDMVKMGAIRRV